MATRGNKNTPLKILPGGKKTKKTTGKGGKPPPPKPPKRDGAIEPPKKLTKVQQRLWDQYIEPAWWLAQADAVSCFMFVALLSEYLQNPKKMIASRMGELRKNQAELHLTSSEQARLGVEPTTKDDTSEFFND